MSEHIVKPKLKVEKDDFIIVPPSYREFHAEGKANGLSSLDLVSDVLGVSKVVIVYGPAYVGKTTMVHRLLLFLLREKEYSVTVQRIFGEEGMFHDVFDFFDKSINSAKWRTISPEYGLFENEIYSITTREGHSFNIIDVAARSTFFGSSTYGLSLFFGQLLRGISSKTMMLVFEHNMFNGDKEKQVNYSDSLASLLRDKMNCKQDRIVIVLTKVDQYLFVFKGGRAGDVDMKAVKSIIFDNQNFGSFVNEIKRGGFGNIPVVAFSSGEFYYSSFNSNELNVVVSHDEYPEKLWKIISSNGSHFLSRLKFW